MLKILAAILCAAALVASGLTSDYACVRAASSPPVETEYLSVLSYNIHVGIGMDKKLDLARIARVIKDERAELVGLQEVDRGVERTGRRDQIAELARLTGMEYAFGPNLPFQGGWYGVAVLSRYPIVAFEHRRYRNVREAETRGFLRVEVMVGRTRVHFVTTHLDNQYEENRVAQTRQLLDAHAPLVKPVIITGDFNDEPQSAVWHLMLDNNYVDAWVQSTGGASADAHAPGGSGTTYPADTPSKRIDYVFYRVDGSTRARGAVVRENLASDHRPLSALISILK